MIDKTQQVYTRKLNYNLCKRMFCLYCLLGILWCPNRYLSPYAILSLIFVYSIRDYSNFIDVQVIVQLSQHHLLKRMSFLHSFLSFFSSFSFCIFLPPLPKINLPYVVGLFLGFLFFFHWSLCLFLCRCHTFDYCSFVYCLQPGRVMPWALFFFLRIALALLDLL